MVKYKFHRYEGISKNLNVTHVSFDMVNEITKTFYGNAYFIDYLQMKEIGRIETIELTDDDFNKINEFREKGNNMFSANDNYIFIK